MNIIIVSEKCEKYRKSIVIILISLNSGKLIGMKLKEL